MIKKGLKRALAPAGIVMLLLGALALCSLRTPSTGWGPLISAQTAEWQAGIDAINERQRARMTAIQAMGPSDAAAVQRSLAIANQDVQQELNAHNLQHARRVEARQRNILTSQVLFATGYSLLTLGAATLLASLVGLMQLRAQKPIATPGI